MIRQEWLVLFQMWGRRNKVLHKDKESLHENERREIDQSIRKEFSISLAGFPQEMNGFFRGNSNNLSNLNPNIKTQWLTSV